MRRKILSTLVFGSLMLVSWGQAEAAEGNQIYQLNPVVVTATRLKENAAEVPASVSVITADQIKQKNVRTITEAINYLPGIYSDRPQGMSDNAGGISIRGFGESNILVLYDGMPLNNGFSGGVNWSTISIDDVAKIELVRGAGSSLYGGRAVGGVINIVSKNPDKNSGKIYTEYGSHDTWRRGVNITRKLTDKWSFSAGYENRRTDGYRKKLSYTKKGASKTPTGTVGTGYEESKNHAGDTIYILGNPGTTASKDNTYNFKLRYNFSDTKSMMPMEMNFLMAVSFFLTANIITSVKLILPTIMGRRKQTSTPSPIRMTPTRFFSAPDSLIPKMMVTLQAMTWLEKVPENATIIRTNLTKPISRKPGTSVKIPLSVVLIFSGTP